MLPDINLDQSTFEEILEKAKNRIAGYYPEWTDFNYHDPGITLVELFAWLKEIQQYELNHIGENHRKNYLRLLGANIRHRQGADAYVCVRATQELCAPDGMRFLAADTVFETEERQILPQAHVVGCLALSPQKERLGYLGSEQMAMGAQVFFYPFGREAEPGSSLYVECSAPLPVGKEIRLTVRVNEGKKRPRNPLRDGAFPLCEFRCDIWDGACYQPVRILRDETFGFLFDGQIRLCLDHDMAPRMVGGKEGYYLRITLMESQYEMPPALCFLDFNTLKVKQRETLSAWLEAKRDEGTDFFVAEHDICQYGRLRVFLEEGEYCHEIPFRIERQEKETGRVWLLPQEPVPEDASLKVLTEGPGDWFGRGGVLGRGHGFPGECFSLEESVLDDALVLLVGEPDRTGYYRRWEKRESFAYSGPEDCHYRVDGAKGQILFGDGFHGMAPEGEILLASYVRMQGMRGNVKAHRISVDPRREDEAWSHATVYNPWNAFGGEDLETVDESFDRIRKEFERTKSMVTAEDYEQAVYRTPGLRVESCKALFDESHEKGLVRIVVKPCSLTSRPHLTASFIRNIQSHLEPGRLLGTRIKICSPVYIRLTVYVEATVFPQYQEAETMIRGEVLEYLLPVTAEFGRVASYSGLYGRIDRLPCVYGIRSLSMEARGNGARKNSYGDICFPGMGIADEIEIQCSCSFAGK